jgi:predicted nuclease with TOPRIM domain
MSEELDSYRDLQTQLKLQQDITKNFEMKIVGYKELDSKYEFANARLKSLELENKRQKAQLDQRNAESIKSSDTSLVNKTQIGVLQITIDQKDLEISQLEN